MSIPSRIWMDEWVSEWMGGGGGWVDGWVSRKEGEIKDKEEGKR